MTPPRHRPAEAAALPAVLIHPARRRIPRPRPTRRRHRPRHLAKPAAPRQTHTRDWNPRGTAMNTDHPGNPPDPGSDHTQQPPNPRADTLPAPSQDARATPEAAGAPDGPDEPLDENAAAPCCPTCGQPGASVTCPECTAAADAAATRYVCAHCGEPAQPVPPTRNEEDPGAATADPAEHPGPATNWSHTDGSPLCPVPANSGEQPGRAEPAPDWPATAAPAEPDTDAADTVATLVALTEILTADEEATGPAITADHGPLCVVVHPDAGLTVDLGRRTPPGAEGWTARFGPGTPLRVIAAAIRAALTE